MKLVHGYRTVAVVASVAVFAVVFATKRMTNVFVQYRQHQIDLKIRILRPNLLLESREFELVTNQISVLFYFVSFVFVFIAKIFVNLKIGNFGKANSRSTVFRLL